MLLALGEWIFATDSAGFNQLQRKRSWRHPSGDRVGARPASQFAGPGDDTVTLSGVLAPGFAGNRDALDDIAAMADAGRAYAVVDGEGYVYGAYVITDLDETKRELLIDGMARLCDFTISLKRVDDDEGETAAAGEPVRA